MKYKIIKVEIACRVKDVKYVERELLQLQEGIYNFGTTVRNPTKEEIKEITSQVPEEMLNFKY